MNIHSTKTKKRAKSFVSGLLCLVMLLSQTPLAFAAEEDSTDTAAVEEELIQTETPETEEPAEETEAEEPSADPEAEEEAVPAALSLELEGYVEITTAQELRDFALAWNQGTTSSDEEIIVSLEKDIDLSVLYTGADAIGTWAPIGTADHPFTGTFMGNNHTISGLRIVETLTTTGNQGLFGVISGNAYIGSLTVNGSVHIGGFKVDNSSSSVQSWDATVTDTNNCAGVVGLVDAKATGVQIEKVTNQAAVVAYRDAGGIVGKIEEGAAAAVSGCTNTAAVSGSLQCSNMKMYFQQMGSMGVGGIVGNNRSADAVITGCTNTGAVTAAGNSLIGAGNYGVGSIAGYSCGVAEDCVNEGEIAKDYVGGITEDNGVGGIVGANGTGGVVEDCTNKGRVGYDGTDSCYVFAGGVVCFNYGTVSGCVNEGQLTSRSRKPIGGIAAYTAGGVIENCTNNADLVNDQPYLSNLYASGGIAGYGHGSIRNCVNNGKITLNAQWSAGGIAGNWTGEDITGCTNNGDVVFTAVLTGSSAICIGGIVGTAESGSYNSQKCVITDCLNTGAVTAPGVTAVGGVAGQIDGTYSADVSYCRNEGAVTALNAAYAGGLIGRISCSSTTFHGKSVTSYSSSTGAVSGGGIAGGLVGYADGNADIMDCYASGTVTNAAEDGEAYGLGSIAAGASVTNCFYYNQTSAGTVVTALDSGVTAKNYFWRSGSDFGGSESGVTADADFFSGAEGLLKTFNSIHWTLDEGAAHPRTLTLAEFDALTYAFTLSRKELENSTATEDHIDVSVKRNGAIITDLSDNAVCQGDVIEVTFAVKNPVETCYLAVGSNDMSRVVRSVDGTDANIITYSITIGDSDLDLAYCYVDRAASAVAWYAADPDAKTFEISTVEQLEGLGGIAAGTLEDDLGYPIAKDNFVGKTVYLTADLDLSGVCWPAVTETVTGEDGEETVTVIKEAKGWTPVGAYDYTAFQGTFDGGVYDEDGNLTGRHTISNLYAESGKEYTALFSGGTIRNLTVDQAEVSGGRYSAILVARGAADNCAVKNSRLTGTAGYLGAISGYGNITNCTVEGAAVNSSSGSYVGGAVGIGSLVENVRVKDCTVEDDGYASYVGGVVGQLSCSSAAASTYLKGLYAENTVVSAPGGSYVGGVVGYAQGASKSGASTEEATGFLFLTDISAAGGSVTGRTYVGGLVGYGYRGVIRGGFASLPVTGNGNYVGGIAGKGWVNSSIYYGYDAQTQTYYVPVNENASYTAAPISGGAGDNPSGMMGSSAKVTFDTSGNCCAAASFSTGDGLTALPADSFTKDEALYYLQYEAKSAPVYWKLEEGSAYPVLADEVQPALYRAALAPLNYSESNTLTISAFPDGGEGYAYTLYGSEASGQWTYLPDGSVLTLAVNAEEGKTPSTFPDGAVSQKDGVCQITINGADIDAKYSFASAVSADTNWYSADKTAFTLTTEAQLRGLAQLVKEGNSFEGVTVTLGNDIAMEGGSWTPIGTDGTKPFAGTFNGNGKTISGLFFYDEGTYTYAGLFGYLTAGSVVKDLTVQGTLTASGQYLGGAAGYSAGALSNITSGVTLKDAAAASTSYAGGVAGYLDGGVCGGCTFTGSIVGAFTNANYVGGIVGYSKNADITGAHGAGSITGFGQYVGGVVGYITGGDVTGSIHTGTIRLDGDFIGQGNDKTGTAGGVVGYSTGNGTVTRCGNAGSVASGSRYIGGVAGYAAVTVSECYNTGAVSAIQNGSKTQYSGSLGGVTGYMSGSVLSSCYNTGTVNSEDPFGNSGVRYMLVGGVAGSMSGKLASSCYSSTWGTQKGEVESNCGSLWGSTPSTEIFSCFYLAQPAEEDGTDSAALTAEKLKTAADQLGLAFVNQEDSYPILRWQNPLTEGVTLNSNDSALYNLSAAAGLNLQTVLCPDVEAVVSVEEAAAFMAKPITAPDGFVFDGWQDSNGNVYDENTTLKNGDSYTAVYSILQIPVTFDYNYTKTAEDGTETEVLKTVNVNYTGLTAPQAAVREGYEFLGWYAAEKAGDGTLTWPKDTFNFATQITEPLTLYANWQIDLANPDWAADEDGTYAIASEGDLYAFARAVSGGETFEGKTITLKENIALTEGQIFTAIGSEEHPFSGTFDGGNHTISNLYIYQPNSSYQALFGYARGGGIKNLTVSGQVTGSQYTAGILGYGEDTALSGLTLARGSSVAGTYASTKGNYAGGIVGTLSISRDATLSNLTNYGSVSGYYAGGVLYTADMTGSTALTLTLKNCANYGAVTASNSYAGGVAAYLVNTTAAHKVVFDGCTNTGAVSGSSGVGGILGYGNGKIAATFDGCTNSGSVAGGYAGGIAGYLYPTSGSMTATHYISAADCENSGAVTGQSYAGGIAGYLYYANYTRLNSCLNSGTVTVSGTNYGAGGIVGGQKSGNYLTLTDCVNEGEITSKTRAAGILGYNYGTTTVAAQTVLKNCVNLGAVTATGSSYAAGIAIDAYRGITLNGCYNVGAVTSTGTSYAVGLAYGYSASYPATLNSCFSIGEVAAASANKAYSGGYSMARTSTVCVLADNTWQYAAVGENAAMNDADSVSVKYTAEQFKDGTVLNALNSYYTNLEQAAIWFQGAEYPVLTGMTVRVDSANATVEAEGLTAGEDGSYCVGAGTDIRFRVTPANGYLVGSVKADDETLTAGADGFYTLTVNGNVTITVSVKKAWSSTEQASQDIESIIESIAGGTQEKDTEDSTYDETLDYNNDGKNDLLDILDILYQQKEQSGKNTDEISSTEDEAAAPAAEAENEASEAEVNNTAETEE